MFVARGELAGKGCRHKSMNNCFTVVLEITEKWERASGTEETSP